MRVGLQGRLFFSHLVVMLVGLGSFIAISHAAAHHLFSGHLDQMAEMVSMGRVVHELREELLDGFENAWSGSTILSLTVGGLTAAALSYWVARRITQPLTEMERVTRQFAAGNWSEQVARSEIPELARLSRSFNHLALSLQDVEERRRELIEDLTHELRTPLTIVRGYLEESAAASAALTPETTHLLVRETRRLERLINDLQELSKAEAGQMPLHLQAIALPPLFEKLLLRFDSQIAEDGPQLGWRCDDDIAPVLADGDRLEQILINLLGNAIKHTRQGQITLTAQARRNQVWIAVQDTGIGIAPDELPHVFERFWRSPQICSPEVVGTGIGLAITKRLVELHGGCIKVESTVGRGSTFRFSLPQA
ncbi:HAMP domain-containing histidine kinase [Nodosilinea sp. LEGE 07298]|uniref:sensor histidine kinase n=1 Tax=Nodosilinea sp. LEGE 07298 TaxID=2777970 RepID=UPI0018826B14|nr:HAMP domain-containing sensor histidine kinase [Nodosilinea sp. LEGE 07298]MBE9113327.1 HAMP domain-containing histidine kinase [Nodosilinea sp. LEGE 07298]